MTNKISVAIVDDHMLFRQGLVSLINFYPEFEIELVAADGSELVEQLIFKKIDLVLLDVQMPVMDGFETAAYLQENYPQIKIIVLSMSICSEQVKRMINFGVSGYLLKNQEIDTLIDAMHSVYNNGYYFNETISYQVVSELMESKKITPHFEHVILSDRELEIIQLICSEYTTKEISDKLNISTRTVEGHRERILLKTNAKNVVGIVMFAVKNKLFKIESRNKEMYSHLIR